MAHAGNHNDAAWRACDAQTLNDGCTFLLHADIRARGTCREVQDELICVRNRPSETVQQHDAASSWPLAGASAALLLPGAAGLVWLRRRRRAGA